MNATPRPWNYHRSYKPAKCEVLTVTPENGEAPWLSAEIAIASGEKLIGYVEMCTATEGWPSIDNIQELKANAELVLRAVNSFDDLLRVCGIAEHQAYDPHLRILAQEAIAKATQNQDDPLRSGASELSPDHAATAAPERPFKQIKDWGKELRHRVRSMESQDCRRELASLCELVAILASRMEAVASPAVDEAASC